MRKLRKNNMLRRGSALALALITLLSCFPLTAFAAGERRTLNGKWQFYKQPLYAEINENVNFTSNGNSYGSISMTPLTGSGGGSAGAGAALNAPIINTLPGDILLFEDDNNGNFTDSYDLYVNGSFLVNIPKTSERTEYPLQAPYFEVGNTYTLTVIAKGEGMSDSEFSVAIEFSPSGVLAFVSNGDGTCYVSGPGSYSNTVLEIPSVSPDGDVVTAIGEEAFSYNAVFTKIVLPATVKELKYKCFFKMLNCTEIVLNEGLETIGQQACSYMGVVHFDFPSTLRTVGDYAFDGSLIEELVVPPQVTSWGKGCFRDTFNVIEIVFPEGMTTIPESFCGTMTKTATNLKRVYIPKSVTNMGNRSFYKQLGIVDVYYGGTEEEWASVDPGTLNNSAIYDATIHFNCSGIPETAEASYAVVASYAVPAASELLSDAEPVALATDVSFSLNFGETVVYYASASPAFTAWIDTGYMTIDFGTELQTVSEEFFQWLNTNAVRVETPFGLVLSGYYLFNDTIDIADLAGTTFEVTFTEGFGFKVQSIIFGEGDTEETATALYFYGDSDILVYENGSWKDQKYRAVNFGDATYVDQNFYDWFMQNSAKSTVSDVIDGVGGSSYLDGYKIGYRDGQIQGQKDEAGKREEAVQDAYENGYTAGKEEGLNVSENGNFYSLFSALSDATFGSFMSLFSFEILGVNMSTLFGSILALCVIAIIIKLCFFR